MFRMLKVNHNPTFCLKRISCRGPPLFGPRKAKTLQFQNNLRTCVFHEFTLSQPPEQVKKAFSFFLVVSWAQFSLEPLGCRNRSIPLFCYQPSLFSCRGVRRSYNVFCSFVLGVFSSHTGSNRWQESLLLCSILSKLASSLTAILVEVKQLLCSTF